MTEPSYSPGLEGIIAGVSAISKVDPQGDELIYYGYKVSQLCEKSNFEEVSYLLLHGALPTAAQFEKFKKDLIEARPVAPEILDILCRQPKQAHYMDILRTGVSLVSHHDKDCDNISIESEKIKSVRLIAAIPTMLAARVRALQGQKAIAPNPELGHAANFLYMLDGKNPTTEAWKALDASLICYAEHGYNASTFTARVCASTMSDIYSCVVGAIGSLKGPLHGGANEQAMYMLQEIGEVSKTEGWLRNALAQKKKIMGFGHRVYKNKDSRAPIIKALGWQLAKKTGVTKWHEMQEIIEKILWDEKKLFPNVDFPAATLYFLLGLPIEVDTPLFVAARMSGWCAHVMEQRIGNRLLRPDSIYNGPDPRDL